MECCCGITSVLPGLPKQVSVTPVVKFVTPGYLLRAHSGAPASVEEIPLEERNFLLREVIPRLYAQLVACAALLNAAGNLTLTVLFFISYSFHIATFANSDSCSKAWERMKNSLGESGANAALFGSGLVFGLYDPNEVLSVAFYEDEPPFNGDEGKTGTSPSEGATSPAFSREAAAAEEPSPVVEGQAQVVVLQQVVSEIIVAAPGGALDTAMILEEEVELDIVYHDDPAEEVTFHFDEEDNELNHTGKGAPSVDHRAPGSPPSFTEATSPASSAAAGALEEPPPAYAPLVEKQAAASPAPAASAPAAPKEERKEEVKVSLAPAPAPAKATVQVDPFTTLAATAPQREATKQLITRLGSANALLLAKDSYQKTLEGFGTISAQMHTLKFLEIILLDPTLKKHMTEMTTRLFGKVWAGFLYGKDKKPEEGDGMNGALNVFADKDDLNKYLPGFYKAVNIDPKVAQPLAEKRQWKAWLELLLGKK